MILTDIKTESEYEILLDWIDSQFDKELDPCSTEGKKLEEALEMVKEYEDKNFLIPNPSLKQKSRSYQNDLKKISVWSEESIKEIENSMAIFKSKKL